VPRTARQGLGAAGEQLARRHLERLGYAFVTANWRFGGGELDLVMRDGDVLVFVEVKTRRGERLGAAEESIPAAQARRLMHGAQMFLAEHPDLVDTYWRIDLLAITLSPAGTVSRLTHIPNAVQSPCRGGYRQLSLNPGPRCANHSLQPEESGMLPTCQSGANHCRDRSRAAAVSAHAVMSEERAPCVFQAEHCPSRVWPPR
jgi:putative endonuclease